MSLERPWHTSSSIDANLSALLKSNRAPTAHEALQIRGLLTESSERVGQSGLDYALELMPYLNGALSALRTFPPELLGYIFLFCRDNSLCDHEPPYSPYPTADPQHAPMVLGHVCSHWRSISYATPRLWNTVALGKLEFSEGGASIVREILARSREVPLSIRLATGRPNYGPRPLQSNSSSFDAVWDSRRVLQILEMNLRSADVIPRMFPSNQVFPILSSVDITIDHDVDYVDFPAILDSFSRAPNLRSLSLDSGSSDARIFETTFPWAQLTHLTVWLDLPADVGRDILIQCQALEVARIRELLPQLQNGTRPLQHVATLHRLRQLEISISEPPCAAVVFNGVSLPRLQALILMAEENTTPILLALHARSHFPLTQLLLKGAHLSTEDLFALLRILPDLQKLTIEECTCIGEQLFQSLTPPSTDTPRLLHLTALTINPVPPEIDGNTMGAMVESLARCTGTDATPFPALRDLHLYRRSTYRGMNTYPGTTFGEENERRLAALVATGFLMDDERKSSDTYEHPFGI
ncbi:hypothetical protein DFH09DRAFT_1464693 [Mycena vulgaris]|nr:hypothetical protein DFH09DRAFT_1464693 [Mycena vulgaris]